MEVQERGYRKQLRSRFQVMNEPGRKLCFAIWSVSPNVMTEYIYIYMTNMAPTKFCAIRKVKIEFNVRRSTMTLCCHRVLET
jgi:hypothetical protein